MQSVSDSVEHLNGGHQGRRHAVVIGGSIVGLFAARILSDHFDRVTVLENDKVPDGPGCRKGQPQARHTHGLMAGGIEVLKSYFPQILDELTQQGAVRFDWGSDMCWSGVDGNRVRHDSKLPGIAMSRVFLEWTIRKRVMAIPNVTVLDEQRVLELLSTNDKSRVTGVRYEDRDAHTTDLPAEFVVDVSGRGSRAPQWLQLLGYQPAEQVEVKMNVGYTTRIYRRKPDDLPGATLLAVTPRPPIDRRMAFLFPMEGDRWIVSLGGWGGDHAPTDEEGYLEFARQLPNPNVYETIRKLEPLSEIYSFKIPSNSRRYYERLKKFPEGFLVLGDAVCSFNPVYAQGMTSAFKQAMAMDQELRRCSGRSMSGLWRRCFRAFGKIVDDPWLMVLAEDLRIPETVGKRTFKTRLLAAYTERVHLATHSDSVVYGALLRVINLVQSPMALFHPGIMWRVLKASLFAPRTPGSPARPSSGFSRATTQASTDTFPTELPVSQAH